MQLWNGGPMDGPASMSQKHDDMCYGQMKTKDPM